MSKKTKNRRMTTPVVVPKKKKAPAEEHVAQLAAEATESLKVPAALVNALFEYLKTQPWEQAQPLIGGLMRCEKLKE